MARPVFSIVIYSYIIRSTMIDRIFFVGCLLSCVSGCDKVLEVIIICLFFIISSAKIKYYVGNLIWKYNFFALLRLFNSIILLVFVNNNKQRRISMTRRNYFQTRFSVPRKSISTLILTISKIQMTQILCHLIQAAQSRSVL